jgi:hypothetical protein
MFCRRPASVLTLSGGLFRGVVMCRGLCGEMMTRFNHHQSLTFLTNTKPKSPKKLTNGMYYQFHLLLALCEICLKLFLHLLIKQWYKFKNFNSKFLNLYHCLMRRCRKSFWKFSREGQASKVSGIGIFLKSWKNAISF